MSPDQFCLVEDLLAENYTLGDINYAAGLGAIVSRDAALAVIWRKTCDVRGQILSALERGGFIYPVELTEAVFEAGGTVEDVEGAQGVEEVFSRIESRLEG